MSDLIMAMAKAHYEAGPHWDAWDEIPQEMRDTRYDAMWQALKLLREPTDEMVSASWGTIRTVTAAEHMAAQLGEPKQVHRIKTRRRFTAMIDKLLEV